MFSDNCLEGHSGVEGLSTCIATLKCSDTRHPFKSVLIALKNWLQNKGKRFSRPETRNGADGCYNNADLWLGTRRGDPPPLPLKPTRCRAAPSPAKTLVQRDRLSVPKRKAHHVAYHRSAYPPTLGPSPVAAAYPLQMAYQIKLNVSPEIYSR